MIETSPNSGAAGHHDHDGHVEVPGPGPSLISCDFKEVDRVEGIITELNLGYRTASRIGDAHGRADDTPLVERRVPGGFQALGGCEDAAQRRPDIFAEDV